MVADRLYQRLKDWTPADRHGLTEAEREAARAAAPGEPRLRQAKFEVAVFKAAWGVQIWPGVTLRLLGSVLVKLVSWDWANLHSF